MYNNYGGYSNNILPYQQQMLQNRINQMEQQYNGNNYSNMYPQQMQVQQQNNVQVLKGRPVSSFDEAKASMIDLDGSLFIFTDVANGKIYTKQITLNGTAELKTYVLTEQPETNIEQVKQNNGSYVLREDFERIIGELKNKITVLEGGNEE